MDTKTKAPGTGPTTCGCGGHRQSCRFGRRHTWGTTYRGDYQCTGCDGVHNPDGPAEPPVWTDIK